LGFCKEYCPVTLSDNWLIKGKEEFEAGFRGRRFKFVGETELNRFKEEPMRFINKDNLSIPPRVMFMGVRGVGLKTQLLKLNQ
jgi:adenylate/nucleoside-diphosphate kinase